MAPRDDEIARLSRAYAAWESWRADVERAPTDEFLAAHEDVRDLLEPMLLGADASTTRDDHLAELARPGATIDAYRLLDRVGVGGMGEVFAAQQTQPVQRRVAVKVLKRGMDSEEIVARFNAERQALARMNHPNIAQVFDGGVTPDGRPYFVLEFVPGRSLIEDCDERRLAPRDRLALFTDVLEAVQHAHQKGIVHRDLKPSNILVTDVDGRPVPKIIDFGIAKAVDSPLTDEPQFTRVGQVVGTPEYMSPEQAEGSTLDVDTRTDVYSAGVLLYELLTGTVPIDVPTGHDASAAAVVAAVRDTTPARPSTRVTDPSGGPVAARRGTDVRQLRRLLSGELDWIVLKALEKDRARRYQTASAFAADLRAYLEDRPVSAGPPTARYRIGKFLARYRGQAIAAGIALVALITGFVSSLLLYWDAESERRAAESARAQEARRAAEAQAVTDFLVDLFRRASPSRSLGEEIPIGVFLDTAARQIGTDLIDEPAVRGRLLHAIGNAYYALGSYGKAEDFLNRATASLLQASPRGRPTLEWCSAEIDLAHVELARAEPGAAGRRFARAEQALRSLDAPPDRLGHVLVGQAMARASRNDVATAEPLVQQGLELIRAAGDGARREVAYALSSYGVILERVARHADALERFRAARELIHRLDDGRDSTRLAGLLLNEARVSTQLGAIDDAERLTAQGLAMCERLYGDDDHPMLARAHVDRAHVLRRLSRLDEATPHLEASLAINERLLHPEHPRLAWSLNDLGIALGEIGRRDEAVAMLERSVRVYRHSGDDRGLAIALSNYGNALADDAGRHADALAAASESLAIAERLDDPVLIPGCSSSLAPLYASSGRRLEAIEMLERAVALQAEHDPRHHLRPWLLIQLAMNLCLEGDHADAEAAARSALELLDERGVEHWHRAVALDVVGWSRVARGDRDGAREPLEQAVAIFERFPDRGNRQAGFAHERLGILDFTAGNAARAADRFAAATRRRERHFGLAHALTIQSIENESMARFTAGQHDAAGPLIEEAITRHRELAETDVDALVRALALAARIALVLDDADRAERHAREGHEHLLTKYGDDHAGAAGFQGLLGAVAAIRGDASRGEAMLREAIDVQARGLPRTRPQWQISVGYLIDVLVASGRDEDAAAWRAKLENR